MHNKITFSKGYVKIEAMLGTLIVLLIAGAIMSVPSTNAKTGWNEASLGRLNTYTSLYEDSFDNHEVTGIYTRSFHIKPTLGPVPDARIVLNTPFSDPELKPSVWTSPDTDFELNPNNGGWSYEWSFQREIEPFERADVWMTLYGFESTFTPGFDYKRNVDPVLITEASVLQTVTIEFTPHVDFYNVHVNIVIQNTTEAEVTFVEGSETGPWPTFEGGPNSVDWQSPEEGIVIGKPYTFSVQLNVHNNLYPDPIFYKPRVSSGAFYSHEELDFSSGAIVIEDAVLDGEITYSGTGLSYKDTRGHIQDENGVNFPLISAPAGGLVWLEYNTDYGYGTMEDKVMNDLLDGRRRGYSNVQNAEDATGRSLTDPALELQLAEGLAAESWSEEGYVEETAYRWEFLEVEENQGTRAEVSIAEPFHFYPGYDVYRELTPKTIMYPGGEQEFTFTFTPLDEAINGVQFHIGLPESELFDAEIVSPTTDPENNIWLSEDQRSLWIQISLESPSDFHPYTFTAKIKVKLNDVYAIVFMPFLHVDARTYLQEYEVIGDSPPQMTTEIGTWSWSSSDVYLWQWHNSMGRSVVLEPYWEAIYRPLSVKLSGEFDYLEKETVRIRIAALVTDASSGESVSDAAVDLKIYGDNNDPLVSDLMVEKLSGTGIYEWQSVDTISALENEFGKGIYLVHVQASYLGGPMASDILEFHIDPIEADLMPLTAFILAITSLTVSIVTLLISSKIRNRTRIKTRAL
jgi:hypothetical protein